MIKQTFRHIQGVGPATERDLWRSGIRNWEDALRAGTRIKGVNLEEGLRESIERYEQKDWAFFNRTIKSSQHWRAYPDLENGILYLDIETSPEGMEHETTVIGLYSPQKGFRGYVKGKNLYDAADDINEHSLIVTFNGTQFDMPIIRQIFRSLSDNHIHIDLKYALQQLEYRGGLKSIEKQLGIARSSETDGMDGGEAIVLWQRHLLGDPHALDLLLKYNCEDVKNLEPLMKFAYRELRAASGVDTPSSGSLFD